MLLSSVVFHNCVTLTQPNNINSSMNCCDNDPQHRPFNSKIFMDILLSREIEREGEHKKDEN